MGTLFDDMIRSRAFWVGYVSASTDYEGCDTLTSDSANLWRSSTPLVGVTLHFHISDYGIKLDLLNQSIALSHPDSDEPMLLGTMDSHQMGDVFRWEEFTALIQNLAERYSPRWALELLLQHYVAITADCAAQHRTMLEGCLGESGVFTATEIDCIVGYSQRVGLRRAFHWLRDPELGWIAEGRDAYSLRQPSCFVTEEDAGDEEWYHFDPYVFRDFMRAVGADD